LKPFLSILEEQNQKHSDMNRQVSKRRQEKKYWEERADGTFCSVGVKSVPEEMSKLANDLFNFVVKRFLERYYGDIEALKNKKILDAGCGIGYNILFFEEFSNHTYAADISEKMVNTAKKQLNRTELCVGDAASLPFASEKFDITLCKATLQHILDDKEADNAISELCRVTKKEGLMIIADEVKCVPYRLRPSHSNYIKYRAISHYVDSLSRWCSMQEIDYQREFAALRYLYYLVHRSFDLNSKIVKFFELLLPKSFIPGVVIIAKKIN